MKNRTNKPKRAYQEPKKAKAIIDMSEEEKIRLGYRNNYTVTPDFSKTPEERKEWKRLHTNKKGPVSAGTIVCKKNQPELNLTVHIAPKEGFKSTYTFKVKERDIGTAINTFLPGCTITHKWYGGKRVA